MAKHLNSSFFGTRTSSHFKGKEKAALVPLDFDVPDQNPQALSNFSGSILGKCSSTPNIYEFSNNKVKFDFDCSLNVKTEFRRPLRKVLTL